MARPDGSAGVRYRTAVSSSDSGGGLPHQPRFPAVARAAGLPAPQKETGRGWLLLNSDMRVAPDFLETPAGRLPAIPWSSPSSCQNLSSATPPNLPEETGLDPGAGGQDGGSGGVRAPASTAPIADLFFPWLLWRRWAPAPSTAPNSWSLGGLSTKPAGALLPGKTTDLG